MDLYKVAKAYLKTEEDVADVMQETTLSAWEHLGELKKAAYFQDVADQNPDQQLQQCVKRTETLHCHERFFHAGRRAADKDRCREFYEMLSCLPEKYKHIFLLYYGQGISNKRRSQRFWISSENTVKSRLRRGRGKSESQLIL